jgi:hypothetical protein
MDQQISSYGRGIRHPMTMEDYGNGKGPREDFRRYGWRHGNMNQQSRKASASSVKWRKPRRNRSLTQNATAGGGVIKVTVTARRAAKLVIEPAASSG